MLLRSLTTPVAAFEKGTGWQIKPEGACKGDVCIPLPNTAFTNADRDNIDIRAIADIMQMPVAESPDEGLYALGPECIGGRALTTAQAPELELPDVDGNVFKLSSLKGKKVVVYAWAPY